MSYWSKYLYFERKVSLFFKNTSLFILCLAFGFIYLWYGFLKVIGISPAEQLVISATEWIFAHEFVIFLGIWEMIIGLFMIIPPLRRFALWLFFLQVPGTFLPLITNPADCFTVFPYGLTLEGQYIFKNLIMIASALVIVASLHAKEEA